MTTAGNTDTNVRTNLNLAQPPMFKVIYLNDEKTTMEFVVESLIDHFDYTVDTAQQITVDIHDLGSACVAVLPYEIAEQKGIEITVSARNSGYPLQIKLEPDLN